MPDLRRIRILLVDDDPDEARLIGDLLADIDGWEADVEWARGYEEGLEKLAGGDVEVCLLDYRLGTRTAIEFLTEPVVKKSRVPVILLTGQGGTEVDRRASEAGADDFLPKEGLTAAGLERALRYAAERRRRMRIEGRFDAVIGRGRELISILDADGSLLYVSPSLERILGFQPSEKLGERSLEEVHPADRERVGAAIAELLAYPERTVELQYRVRHADGSWRMLDTVAENRLDDPDVGGIVVSSWDVTERVEQERRARFRANLLDAVGQAVMATDLDGVVVYWNRAAEEIFGWSAEEALGRDVVEVTPSDSTRAEAAEIMDAMRRGEPWSGEFELRRRSGEVFPALVTNSPILDEDGRQTGIIGVSSDISDLKEVEAALNERVKELRTLYAGTRILNAPESPLRERLQAFVEALPPGWLHPDVTEARLTLGDVTASTPGFRPTPWRIVSEVRRDGTTLGLLEVVLTEERPPLDEGPFLKEERELLDRLAADVAEAVERERLTRELESSEQRLRQIAEHIEDAFWISSPDDGTVEYISPAYRTIWGRDPADVRSDAGAWLESVHPDDRERVEEATLRQAEEERNIEYRIVRPDGSIRWIQDRSFPVRNEAGEVERVVGVAADVTERKRTGERLDLLSREMSDAMLVHDEAGRVRFATPSISRMLGYSPEELEGVDVTDGVHPDDRGRVRAQLRNLMEGKSSRERSEHRVLRKDGSVRHVEAIATNLLHHPGIEGILVTVRDVTERVELEEKVLRTQRLEAVGRLAGGVAHDFNNLLTVIRSQTDLVLMDAREDDPIRVEVEAIQSAADRAARLTSQLLAFSREQVLQPRVVRIGDVVERMSALLERVIAEDVRIEMDLAGDLPPVAIDPAQLEQAVLNLAINARDAMPDGGTLGLSTSHRVVDRKSAEHGEVEPGTYGILRVSDTGVGMDEETRRQIFEPFFTTRAGKGGTGLGLSMVYGFMRQSDGHIVVESSPGAGTTFTLYFPTVDAEVEELEGYGNRTATTTGLSGRLLVVEDDDSVRRVAVKILERAGLDVMEARSVDEALQRLERWTDIDAVLTDLVLPGRSGRFLIDRLGESRPRIPAIVMSGYSADSPGHRGDLPSDVPFVQKPFTPSELLDAVQRALTGG